MRARRNRAIVEVQAPYAENPNLRAQQGTFTLVTYTTPRKPGDWRIPPLEEVLLDWCERQFESRDFEMDSFPFLIKFTAAVRVDRLRGPAGSRSERCPGPTAADDVAESSFRSATARKAGTCDPRPLSVRRMAPNE
jgi:hypothetical protein